MKLLHPFVLSLFFTPSIKIVAQDIPSVEKNLFKIDFLDPGFTFEHGLTANSTLNSEIGLGLGYKYSDNYGSTFIAYPFILEDYRYYYNFQRRIRKGKSISRNSGNYFGANAGYNFKPITKQEQKFVESSQISVLYGLQRTYKRGFNVGYQVGVGYQISKSDDDGFTPYFRFTMGWVLGKRK